MTVLSSRFQSQASRLSNAIVAMMLLSILFMIGLAQGLHGNALGICERKGEQPMSGKLYGLKGSN